MKKSTVELQAEIIKILHEQLKLKKEMCVMYEKFFKKHFAFTKKINKENNNEKKRKEKKTKKVG